MNEDTTRRAAKPSAGQCLAWAALLATVLWLSLRGWGSFQVGAYRDDAVYLVLARSLAFGHHYGLVNEPGPPSVPKLPFGFPLILAGVVGSVGTQSQTATAVSLVATLFNLTLLFWGWPLLSPATSRWWGLGVASLHGLSPLVIGHTRMLMAEPVFFSFVLASLLLAEASVLRPERARWLSAPLGVALMMALFTRTLGITTFAAVVLRLGASIRRIGYAPLVGALGASLCSLLVVLALTPIKLRDVWPSKYLAELSTNCLGATTGGCVRVVVTDRVPVRASDYVFGDLRRIVLPLGGGDRERQLAARLGLPALPSVLAVTITGLLGLGAWYAFRTRALSPSVMLFELLYFGTISLWPWSDRRLLYPLQPFLAMQFLLGVKALADGARRVLSRSHAAPRQPLEVVFACATLLAISLAKSFEVQDSVAFTRDLRVGTTWLADHAPREAVVMGRYPQALYLYSGRRTVPLEARTGEALERALDENRVDYLLLGPGLTWSDDGSLDYDRLQRGLLPAVAELTARGRLTQVYESTPRELVRVYRVERGPLPRSN